MATIDKKLIHFNQLADFEARLAAGDIQGNSIVCIKDAKLIWTHGQYYGDLSECLKTTQQTLTDEEQIQVMENLGYYFLEWDGESDTIQLSDEEYQKLLNAKVPVLRNFDTWIYPSGMEQGFFVLYRMDTGVQSVALAISMLSNPLTVAIQEIIIPTKTSDLENDSSFVSAEDAGEKVDGVEVTYATEAYVDAAVSGKQDVVTDLASIREGANKGATALQEEQYKGTVTSITAGAGLNGGTITSEGTISLPETVSAGDYAFTSMHNYLVSIGNTPSNTSMTKTSNSVTLPQRLSFDKYGRLVNQGTIGKSLPVIIFNEATTTLKGLMSASDKVKLDGVRAMVNHGTSDTTFALTPNVYHKWGTVTSLNLTLAAASDSTLYNEYLFEFVSGTTATTLSLPDTVSWVTEPDIEAGKTYQCSIVNNIGIIVGV